MLYSISSLAYSVCSFDDDYVTHRVIMTVKRVPVANTMFALHLITKRCITVNILSPAQHLEGKPKRSKVLVVPAPSCRTSAGGRRACRGRQSGRDDSDVMTTSDGDGWSLDIPPRERLTPDPVSHLATSAPPPSPAVTTQQRLFNCASADQKQALAGSVPIPIHDIFRLDARCALIRQINEKSPY